VLRLADGRIVEHNPTIGRPGWLEPLLAYPLHLLAATPRHLTVTRLTLAAGAHQAAGAVGGLRLLVVERGAVDVQVTSLALGTVSHATLRAGAQLILRADVTPPWSTAYQADNDGEEPAVLLDITLTGETSSAPPGQQIARDSSQVSAEVLILGKNLAGLDGPAVFTLGRAILAPDDRLGWSTGEGVTLLHVEPGAQGERPGGGVDVRQSIAGGTTLFDSALGAGESLLVAVRTDAEVRVLADRPVPLLVATLRPFESAASAHAATPGPTPAGACRDPSGVTRADPARCTP
jgi:hypothetical protein